LIEATRFSDQAALIDTTQLGDRAAL